MPAASSSAYFRHSALFVALLLPFVLLAFWPSYLSRAFAEPQWRVHLHGLAMFGWLALVLSQAFLIRGGRRSVHRRVGKLSFALVPLIVASTLALAHFRLNAARPDLPADLLYFFYVQLALLSSFVLAWGLAIAHRREPLVHARYMLCTVLALLDPIFARIFYNVFGIDYPWGQVLTFGLTDGILVALIAYDRRSGAGSTVFAGMLALFVAVQLPTFVVSTTPAWRAFALWYAALPL
jgi:hypothetical protein